MTEERIKLYLDKFRGLISKVMDDENLEEEEKYIILEIASEEAAESLDD